jgi:hypothetical protein
MCPSKINKIHAYIVIVARVIITPSVKNTNRSNPELRHCQRLLRAVEVEALTVRNVRGKKITVVNVSLRLKQRLSAYRPPHNEHRHTWFRWFDKKYSSSRAIIQNRMGEEGRESDIERE